MDTIGVTVGASAGVSVGSAIVAVGRATEVVGGTACTCFVQLIRRKRKAMKMCLIFFMKG